VPVVIKPDYYKLATLSLVGRNTTDLIALRYILDYRLPIEQVLTPKGRRNQSLGRAREAPISHSRSRSCRHRRLNSIIFPQTLLLDLLSLFSSIVIIILVDAIQPVYQ